MDHKILILGITIFIVILLLSFRKEKYEEVNQESEEEEQEKREQLVEDAYDLKTLLGQIRQLQDDEVDKEKAINAFYDDIYNNTEYGPSAEEAGEAYNKEIEKQIEYLQTWLKLARGVVAGQEDKKRAEYEALLSAYVDKQAREWFGENYSDEGFDNILGKKSIVKIENNIGAVVDEGKYITWWGENIKDKTWYPNLRPVGYSSLMSHATGDPFYQTTSGLYHKEVSSQSDIDANEYWMMVPKCGTRWDGEASCLDINGVADKFVFEDGIQLQESLTNSQGAWATCATACVNSPTDECSGFSLSIKDGKYRCKLTRDKYEDVKLKKIDNEIKIKGKTFLTGEDVYAIHEGYAKDNWDSYLKNPLYAKLFSGAYGGNDKGEEYFGDLLTSRWYGEYLSEDAINKSFDSDKGWQIGTEPCSWRTDCQAKYEGEKRGLMDIFCKFDSSGAKYFGRYECENPKKIENDGLPRNCEGSWKVVQNPGQDKHPNGCPNRAPTGASNNKPCFNSDPNESDSARKRRRPTYTKRFSALGGGAEATNGGSCPQDVSTTMLCRDGPNGEEGDPLQVCKYDHGGWYENPPINCGATQAGEPGVVSVNQVKVGDCKYKTECPTYEGYAGGSISGTAKVIGYDDQGKQPKDGGKSCYDVIKQKIIEKDPSWNAYGIEGNDIVYKCQKTCPAVAAPPPPASCDTNNRGGTCTGSLSHGGSCYEDCPNGNIMDYSMDGKDYGFGVAKAYYCDNGTLSYQPTRNVSCKRKPVSKFPWLDDGGSYLPYFPN
jgi:hypothetical protein